MSYPCPGTTNVEFNLKGADLALLRVPNIPTAQLSMTLVIFYLGSSGDNSFQICHVIDANSIIKLNSRTRRTIINELGFLTNILYFNELSRKAAKRCLLSRVEYLLCKMLNVRH